MTSDIFQRDLEVQTDKNKIEESERFDVFSEKKATDYCLHKEKKISISLFIKK